MKRLPEAELAVMQALWEENRPMSRAKLETRLQNRKWAATTLNTYLTRLVGKDFLHREKQGKGYTYRPKVQKTDYLAFESEAVLHHAFGSSLKSFITALAGTGSLDAKELEEAQRYLQELTGKEHGHE